MTKRILPSAVPKKEGKRIKDRSPPWSPRKFFALSIVGSRTSGKTNLVAWCLLNGWLDNYKNVVIFSPSVTFDKTWTSVEDYDNILASDECSDAILNQVMDHQKRLWRKSHKNDLLIIVDDFSSVMRTKGGFTKTLDKIFSTARHYGTSICITAQFLNHISPTCRLNSTNVIVFRLNDKEYTKLAEEYRMFLSDKEFIQNAIEATHQRYHFFYIDMQTEDRQKVFTEGFHD